MWDTPFSQMFLRIPVFWDVTPCHWVRGSWCSEVTQDLHLQWSNSLPLSLKVKALHSSETSAIIHLTQHHILEDLNPNMQNVTQYTGNWETENVEGGLHLTILFSCMHTYVQARTHLFSTHLKMRAIKNFKLLLNFSIFGIIRITYLYLEVRQSCSICCRRENNMDINL
jgi:hypothetical protein